jgi:acyl carrier protein
MHDELIAAIGEWNPALHGEIDRQTSLIASARLDSLSLMRLLMWVEQKVGQPVDVTGIEIARDWDTVDAVIGFIERAREPVAPRPE